jgi:uncharacterized protein YqeY
MDCGGSSHGGDELPGRLRRSLRDAMKARDAIAVAALRSALSALANAEAVAPLYDPTHVGSPHVAGSREGVGGGDVPRARVTADRQCALLREQVRAWRSAADEASLGGRSDHAARLRAEAEVVERALASAPR